jgi:hypothetical protein
VRRGVSLSRVLKLLSTLLGKGAVLRYLAEDQWVLNEDGR